MITARWNKGETYAVVVVGGISILTEPGYLNSIGRAIDAAQVAIRAGKLSAEPLIRKELDGEGFYFVCQLGDQYVRCAGTFTNKGARSQWRKFVAAVANEATQKAATPVSVAA
jgi:hypothetical protein